MEKKRGISKIAIILIVVILIAVIGTVIGVIFLMNRNDGNDEVVQEPLDIYNENQAFKEEIIENSDEEELEALDKSLTEYRNDEYGIRFGYPTDMQLPTDSYDEDEFFHSVMRKDKSTKIVELIVGELDNLSAEGEYLNERLATLNEEAQNVEVSYGLLGNQMAIKFHYELDGLQYLESVTIKDKVAYTLCYCADADEYMESEAKKVLDSLTFVNSYMDYPKSSERTIKIEGKEYHLPIKITNVEGLFINPKYSSEELKPNYFSKVSLYQIKDIKYSAYIYNAKASVATVDSGYLIGIETDKFKGGDLEILDGIKIGMTRAEVLSKLGNPVRQYISEEDGTVVASYTVNDATVEIKYKPETGSIVDENTEVYGLSIRFKR